MSAGCVYAPYATYHVARFPATGQALWRTKPTQIPARQQENDAILPTKLLHTHKLRRGDRRSVSKGCVHAPYVPYATYQTARQSADEISWPAVALPLPDASRGLGAGGWLGNPSSASDPGRGYPPPPPPVYILYLYCCSKRGQNEGIFRASQDESHCAESRFVAHSRRNSLYCTQQH